MPFFDMATSMSKTLSDVSLPLGISGQTLTR
jgi:hypothetical protein